MGWIKVEDGMPDILDTGKLFLCVVKKRKNRNHQICEYFDQEIEGEKPYFLTNGGYDTRFAKEVVTHWCELPKLPKYDGLLI